MNVAEVKGEGAEEVIHEAEVGGEGPPEENLVEELIAPQPHSLSQSSSSKAGLTHRRLEKKI